MIRLLTFLAALCCAGAASARDLVVVDGRPYTYEELAPTAEASRQDFAVRLGVSTPSQARWGAAIRNLRSTLVEVLPPRLGLNCDTAVTDADVAAYVAWWDRLTDKQADDLEADLPELRRKWAAMPEKRKRDRMANWFNPAEKEKGVQELRARTPHDPADPAVLAQGLKAVGEQKRYACLMRAYPQAPFGAGATFKAQFDNVAPLSLEGTPVAQCLNTPPNGAIWDLIKAAEDRGVLVWKDRSMAAELSSAKKPRPAAVGYMNPQPCIENPPWTAAASGA